MPKLTVGQKLWLVPLGYYGHPHESTVVKVGRKWADLDREGWRIDMTFDHMPVFGDGGGHLGRCYPSREHHEQSVKLNRAWLQFHKAVYRAVRAPDGLTLVNLQLAADLLGIQLTE